MRKHYKPKKALPGPENALEFKDDKLTLVIPPLEHDLWKVYSLTNLKVQDLPMHPPFSRHMFIMQISKNEVDDHYINNKVTVPHCEFMAMWTKEDQPMEFLIHTIKVEGTREETHFGIIIQPGNA